LYASLLAERLSQSSLGRPRRAWGGVVLDDDQMSGGTLQECYGFKDCEDAADLQVL
jgi:hypothetical protein